MGDVQIKILYLPWWYFWFRVERRWTHRDLCARPPLEQFSRLGDFTFSPGRTMDRFGVVAFVVVVVVVGPNRRAVCHTVIDRRSSERVRRSPTVIQWSIGIRPEPVIGFGNPPRTSDHICGDTRRRRFVILSRSRPDHPNAPWRCCGKHSAPDSIIDISRVITTDYLKRISFNSSSIKTFNRDSRTPTEKGLKNKL